MTEADLAYEVHGDRGPHLLLVHGMLSSRAQWDLNLAALRGVARPVVVELFGHGRSPNPRGEAAFTPGHYVSAFERLRERLGDERWFVCGQSLGGALTLRYALEHPGRVIAQIFTNSNSALARADWTRAAEPAMQELAAAIRARGREALERMAIHPRRAMQLPAGVRDALIADSELHAPDAIAKTALHTVLASSVRERIDQNRVPTLLVRGRRERRFDEAAEFAARTMPLLQTVDIDAGHAVNIEAADAFNAAVIRFVEAALSPSDPSTTPDTSGSTSP